MDIAYESGGRRRRTSLRPACLTSATARRLGCSPCAPNAHFHARQRKHRKGRGWRRNGGGSTGVDSHCRREGLARCRSAPVSLLQMKNMSSLCRIIASGAATGPPSPPRRIPPPRARSAAPRSNPPAAAVSAHDAPHSVPTPTWPGPKQKPRNDGLVDEHPGPLPVLPNSPPRRGNVAGCRSSLVADPSPTRGVLLAETPRPDPKTQFLGPGQLSLLHIGIAPGNLSNVCLGT